MPEISVQKQPASLTILEVCGSLAAPLRSWRTG